MLKIIKNSRQKQCTNCGAVHEFMTKPTEGIPCSRPVAYEESIAIRVANMHAGGRRDIATIPTGTDVILADNARKLPVREEPELARFTLIDRMI